MIYLDNAATSLPLPEVLQTEHELETVYFVNPSSLHRAGFLTNKALEEARKKILSLYHCEATHRLVFTSGATEANNQIIKGVAQAYANRGKKLITSATEHPSVLNTFSKMKDLGYEVVVLPVNSDGIVEPKTLEEAMDKQTILVSIMGINNETGAINDLKALAAIVHRFPKAFFHSDLTQYIGKCFEDLSYLDAYSFSAHKFGGLKGAGALVMAKRLNPSSLLDGGEQEGGYRAGTQNVIGALSMAKALEICASRNKENLAKAVSLMSLLEENLAKLEDFLRIESPKGHCPSIVNISLKKHKASVIVEALSERDIYLSSVSACSSKSEPISYVLTAMGRDEETAGNSIRISISPATTEEEILVFYDALKSLFQEVRPR